MLSKTRTIVLRTTKYAESDLILLCLSENGELLSLLAKGALKSRKRFAGGILEPMHCLRILYKPGSEGKMGLLTEAQVDKDFAKVRQDLDRLNLAFYFLQVVGKLGRSGAHEQESLFNILGHSLERLQDCENISLLKLQFQIKVLHQQGVLAHRPEYKDFLQTPLSRVDEIPTTEAQLQAAQRGAESALNAYLT